VLRPAGDGFDAVLSSPRNEPGAGAAPEVLTAAEMLRRERENLMAALNPRRVENQGAGRRGGAVGSKTNHAALAHEENGGSPPQQTR